MLVFIISVLIVYLLYKKICKYGKNNNLCPYKFNQFKIKKSKKIHLHHWLIHLIIIIIFLYFEYYNLIFLGLNFGGLIHGIYEYDNWYIIYS